MNILKASLLVLASIISQSAIAECRWVQETGGRIPTGAVAHGHESGGTFLYVARARVHDGIHPGKVRPEFQGANIPYGGKEEANVNPYEVLVGNCGGWVKMRSSTGEVPMDALVAGRENDNQVLYVARARIHGGVHPGKVRPGLGGADIGYGGQEETVTEYEVLLAPE